MIFVLNGQTVGVPSEPFARLLDVLRERFGLVGVKEGCGEGECGACAVLVDGVMVNSCITPLASVHGKSVLTIEGLRETERCRIYVDAYAEAGAVQCGFCTPGFLIATDALLRSNPNPSEEEIRQALSGNLCRCTGYNMIFAAVRTAAERCRDAGLIPVGPAEAGVSTAPPVDPDDPSNAPGTSPASSEPQLPADSHVTILRPTTLADALRLAAETNPLVYGGGTDLMVQCRRPAGLPADHGGRPVMRLDRIAETRSLKRIDSSEGSALRIGAGVTLARLSEHPDTPSALLSILPQFAAPGIRASATVGGNVCNASPAGDLLPFLYARDAVIDIQSADGARTERITDFILGPGRTTLRPGEIVVSVTAPLEPEARWFYRKVAARRSNALSKLSVYVELQHDGQTVKAFRAAVGSVAPTVVRSTELESRLVGVSVGRAAEMVPDLLTGYGELISPIDDQRSTADYRRATALRLLATAIENLLHNDTEEP